MTGRSIPVEGAADKVAPEGEEQVTAPDAAEAVEATEAEELDEGAVAGEGEESSADEASASDEGSEPEETEEPADDADAQADALEAARKEAAEYKDRYARLQAEWDNFRKRTATERASERERAAEKLVEDLLPAFDDIERALNHAKESGDGSGLVGGVEAIQTKFFQILEKHKVSIVPAQGEPFDAMKHQAVGTAEDESVPEETVIQVYQQGYQMGDKVIRPAMVVTSTGGPTRPVDAE